MGVWQARGRKLLGYRFKKGYPKRFERERPWGVDVISVAVSVPVWGMWRKYRTRSMAGK